MLPCIGHIVAARPDHKRQKERTNCRLCKNQLTDLDHALLPKLALCSICYDQLMKSQPQLTQ